MIFLKPYERVKLCGANSQEFRVVSRLCLAALQRVRQLEQGLPSRYGLPDSAQEEHLEAPHWRRAKKPPSAESNPLGARSFVPRFPCNGKAFSRSSDETWRNGRGSSVSSQICMIHAHRSPTTTPLPVFGDAVLRMIARSRRNRACVLRRLECTRR
jgi:hypothetical protein